MGKRSRMAATTRLSMSDDLVQRAQAGDADAFSALTAPKMARLYAVAKLILRDEDHAADAVQDALLRAWTDLRGLRQPDRFDAWLRRILVRSCYRAAGRRRSRRVAEIKVRWAEDAVVSDAERDVAIRDQLERGFGRLSPQQRAVIVLRHYLGLSTLECAEALGIPPGTVQSRLDRATDAMRAAIEADDRAPALLGEVAR
jgi:RNA polymerase sigma-70 factor (ECF subfamily)